MLQPKQVRFKGIVDVSIDNAYSGFYLTPDMWFYSSVVLGEILHPIVRTVIHAEQPLAHHYADFAASIYDFYAYDDDVRRNLIIRTLMTLSSLSMGESHLERGVWALTQVAVNVYFRTRKITETSDHLLLIPPSLHDLQISRPWQLSPDIFRRIVRVEPWLSWTERLRAETARTTQTLSDPRILSNLVGFWDAVKQTSSDRTIDPIAVKRREHDIWRIRQAARRSVKRAVKLHERFNEGASLRRFIAGQPVIINGVAYDYCLQKCHSLVRTTIDRDTEMAPLSLTIQNKQGFGLATGCLVIEDVSVLDYLFHVRVLASNAESEHRMLLAMHITSVTERFFDDPLHVTKGILDRYTAPLHTVENLLSYARNSSHNEERISFYNLWRDMALRVILEAADIDLRYYEVLTACRDYTCDTWESTENNLEIAIKWAKTRPQIAKAPLLLNETFYLQPGPATSRAINIPTRG